MKTAQIEIFGQVGRCGDREVFMSFAPASLLAEISFADTFDQANGRGYQRPFNRQHSLEFKRYIQQQGASTIPLTFNLRPEFASKWSLECLEGTSNLAVLRLKSSEKVMSQVDCQHRLGYLTGSAIEFAFMAYLGLQVADEMAIFRDINGKAKGLSSSLLDSTEARLAGDKLKIVKPELFYALQLNEDTRSVWHQRLNLGGEKTVGMKRAASLRTMQQAVRRFLLAAHLDNSTPHEQVLEMLINFWAAIKFVLPEAWENHRRHLLAKGVGVYSLMSVAGELVCEARNTHRNCDLDYFIDQLSDFIDRIDWSNKGPLEGYGGVKGADAALALLRHARAQSPAAIGNYGKQEYFTN